MHTKKKRNGKGKAKPVTEPLVSHTHKPDGMTEAEWQTRLRRQVAEKEPFDIENIGNEPFYSDFRVFSPKSGNTYKVAMRSADNRFNFCTCLDFKTNLLGTCKHIEAVRLSLLKKRGAKRLAKIIPEIPYSSLYVSYYENRAVKLRIGSDREKEFQQWSRKYFDADNVLLPAAYFDIEKLLAEARELSPAFRCYDDALSIIIARREQQRRSDVVAKRGGSLLNGLIRTALFPYQREGVLFAVKAGRCILADDMGLGKTLQAIAWAMLMKREFGAGSVVVVCPTSLKYQWKTEIEKFADTTVTVVEGNPLKRIEVYERGESHFKIVSYHVAGNDWRHINAMNPDIVILDEAQRIKNWRAKTSQNIKRLTSPYTMLLTGTPLENNIEELYSLVQYADPYLLGSLHHFLSAHVVREPLTGKIKGYKDLNKIGAQLSGMLLRRTKKEVLKQLPDRMDKILFVPMTLVQAQMHEEYADTVAKLVYKWRKQGFLTEKERQNLLNCLGLMRMVCDTTYIIDQNTNHQTKLDELFNILDELFLNPDEKVVIFSQWERMTRLVAAGLKELGVKFEYLHGGVPSKNRAALFANFNNDPECRVFLSTDAGGVGLNLQAAANLINMDIPWNPAVLEQRIARIYRLGQTKKVSITNFVAENTIEHRMLSVLKFKGAVAGGVLDNGENTIFLDDENFKHFMDSVEQMVMPEEAVPTVFEEAEKQEIGEPNPDAAAQLSLDFDQEEAETEPAREGGAPMGTAATPSPEQLLQNGITFFAQLMSTLSNPEATKALTKSITEKDEKTGQTFLKIPVQNAEVVETALTFLSKMFSK